MNTLTAAFSPARPQPSHVPAAARTVLHLLQGLRHGALTLHLPDGKTFTIVAENNSPKNIYIQSATLNGKPLERSWFTHAELVAGGELVLKMGPEPNKTWRQKVEQRPPAMAP